MSTVSEATERRDASARRLNPRTIAAVMLVALLIGGVVSAWRYVALLDAPPKTYYEFQIRRWEEQLVADPDNPAVWATLGGLHDKAGDERKAEKAFARALEIDPENTAALVYNARKEGRNGNLEEARSLLTSAVAGLPEGGRYLVYFELGELERAQGNDEAAIKAYAASVKDNNTFWNAPYELALLYEKAGDLDAALGSALRAQLFSPQDDSISKLVERLESQGATATIELRIMKPEGQDQ